jgi:hypothetical protein
VSLSTTMGPGLKLDLATVGVESGTQN